MEDKKMNTAPITTEDTSAGTAADVEAVMKKYDRESNTRVWEGTPKKIVYILGILFSVYCIFSTLKGWPTLPEQKLNIFLGMILIIGYLHFPVKKGITKVNYLPWYDIIIMVAGAFPFFYFAYRANDVIQLASRVTRDPKWVVLAILGVLALMELCRRSVGLPILCVLGALLVYTFMNVRFGKVIYDLFYTTSGVMGTPINVCQKYIVVFIIFGAFLERTGISNFFINLANCVAGSSAGGPAKVAVISSALCGMVSGSSVGNTVTTGSTGGQIMPPIMGAAAFLMAEYVGVSYSNIIVRAILPAILYFLGIFIAVHLEAKKLGLKGVPASELPRVRNLVKDTYLLLPLVILVWLVSSNTKTMQFSAAVAILAAILVGFINNALTHVRARKAGSTPDVHPVAAAFGAGGGFGVRNIFDALDAGGRGCITVGVACGIAGIIAGCLTVTGLASKMINVIVGISGSSSLLALLLTMLCCIVLGMGVPTTANYCIMASTCAPILIKMGIPTIAAHFFVFYFGIVADITPPVALAAYAGSAIAKGNPMKTGVTATRLAIAAFIIPFVFAYSPSLLFIDTVWYDVVLIGLTATIGMVGIAAGLSGYLLRDMNLIERLVTIAGGLLLIIPGIWTDLGGVLLIAVILVWQALRRKKTA